MVKKLLGGKAPGVDEIHPQFLKALHAVGLSWLTCLCNIVWSSGQCLWIGKVVVPLFKIRGITINPQPPWVLEGTQKFADQSTCALDLEKALDCVPRGVLWGMFQKYQVPNLLISGLVRIASNDYDQKALCSKHNRHAFGFLVDSNDFCHQTPGVQECGRSFSSSSQQSSLSVQSPLSSHHQRTDRRSGKLTSDYKCTQMQADCTRTLEFFVDPPSEPTLIQERNHWHAMEVTQHFFETVSIQLERWYERKVLEVEEQTKVKMEQERQELLQHINVLEEELQKLKTGVNAET
ncbi:uncharacterized protein LOC109518523 [Hippocampus comes]|uniref:uncharacterized protein LOC109518523 n=1 Tax=Hippocampus comes TaxID=109280 RepID=UPI00094E7208|nr:PREDICTED: uncharacterized protein LOC109518523 [Hippocampus comes]